MPKPASMLFRDVASKSRAAWLRSRVWGYAAVLVMAAIAIAARPALAQLFGPNAPMLPFIPALLIGAWLGGLGPGLLATALGTLAGAWFFLGPGISLANLETQHTGRLGLFIIAGLIVSALLEQLHRARRRAETSEAQLSAILGQLPVGVGLLDPRGRLVLANRLMQRLPLPQASAGGSTRDPTAALRDDAGNALDASAWPGARALRGEAIDPGIECRGVNENGEETWYSIAAVPMKGDDGRIDGAVVVMQDIDRIKRSAAALEEADRRKDAFLATLAHELRNPLAPIRNAVEMLKQHGPDDPVVVSVRGVIDRQVTHLVRLVDDLLDVSRITRDRLALRLDEVLVQDVVEQALEIVRPQIDRRGQSLVVALPDAPVHVRADAVRLAQVITNVLSNASKFSPADGVVSLSVSSQGDRVVIAIEDTGVGIEPDQLPALFEMFTQGEHTTAAAHGGLGIGLWLSRQLMEMHGGTIEAASGGLGKGSRFTLTLPRIARPAATTPVAVSRAAPHERPLRVLVVEDNVDGAATLAELLRAAGHAVEVAGDGRRGIELAGKFRPDVMLLDIGLPKLDGYEVCRMVRRQPWGKAMSIIAMTGWGQEHDRRKSMLAGFDAHLVKPVDFEALNEVLHSGRRARTAAAPQPS